MIIDLKHMRGAIVTLEHKKVPTIHMVVPVYYKLLANIAFFSFSSHDHVLTHHHFEFPQRQNDVKSKC